MRLSFWRTSPWRPAASIFRRATRAVSATALNPDDYRPIGTHRVGCIGIEVPSVVANEPNVESVLAVLGKAFESGVTLVDTCEPQGTLLSAEVVRQSMIRHNTNQDIVITGHIGIQNGVVNHSEDSLKYQLEALLGTLGVSSIPLLFLSGIDQKHDWLAAIKTLKSFRDQKLCQMIGVSEVDSNYIKVAINEAGISAVRYPCSVVNREAMANGVLDQCDTNSLALLASRPFGPPDQLSKLTHHPVLRQLADKHDTTPLQICLSWLLLTPCVIPLSPLSSVRIDGASIDLDLTDLELFEKLQTQL